MASEHPRGRRPLPAARGLHGRLGRATLAILLLHAEPRGKGRRLSSDTGKGMPPKTRHTPSSANTRGEVSDARGHRRQLRGRFVTGDSPWSHLTIRWRGRRRKPPRTRPRPLYPKSGLTRRDEPAAYYAFLYSVFTSKVPSGRL